MGLEVWNGKDWGGEEEYNPSLERAVSKLWVGGVEISPILPPWWHKVAHRGYGGETEE